ncbi:rab9 effector protein with kelch motifs isoform X2 [Falco biarmicus]|uniref:rab9 effector protein with kelch motifs isoform X2 n=1 Tax=Falco rusticolus TaxID=120794 RepID=UPI0018868D72|nr:rab9 effector protein with kelch motifs isoform X2 [Falco rusticolus]XP_055577437.1 rab9 effector protein with kelch motifs isoform X2 [Falco cherrug]XP_055650644.1 rab9 effector protein with kelch motifs isoform X2 [Falco peregrinus]XP_056209014.1 rab9 effector protein with kelch motifs isoform X2 [Falco biarmicus]
MGLRALPLLEPGRRPQPTKWYRLSPRGERPRGRVGHGCLFLPGGGPGRVLLLGGADPAGAFADAHFVELEMGTWKSPEVRGLPPLPRTFHTSSAAIGDCLYVFGGGEKGAEPVQDQQLHVFDTATLSWSQPDTHGDPPSPRHGHVVVAVGTKLFIHGGLAGDTFYNDLFCIDTNDMRWVKIPATGDVPGGRASHSSAVFKDHLYIFGGIGPAGTLDTTYKYHTERQQWTLLQFDSPLPAGRLDHAMCIIPWQAAKSGGTSTWEDKAGDESPVLVGSNGGPLQQGQDKGCAEGAVVHLLFVFGGMDTQGEIYRDCVVSLIE